MSNKVVGLYRQLLSVARRIPEADKREKALQEIRTGFRSNLENPSQESVKKLLSIAESKLGYLKIVTPKGQRRSTESGRESFVMKDGKLVEGHTVAPGRTIRSGLDADDLAKHHRLLRRQHFMDR